MIHIPGIVKYGLVELWLAKLYDKAWKLFESMDNEGFSPDECTYDSLNQMFAAARLPNDAI